MLVERVHEALRYTDNEVTKDVLIRKLNEHLGRNYLAYSGTPRDEMTDRAISLATIHCYVILNRLAQGGE